MLSRLQDCLAERVLAFLLVISTLFTAHEVAAQCADVERNCAFWAGVGECANNPSFMRPNCRLSCGLCQSVRRILALGESDRGLREVVFGAPDLVPAPRRPVPFSSSVVNEFDTSPKHRAIPKPGRFLPKQKIAEPAGGGDCSDQHSFCGFWAGIGECNNNANWMQQNCRRSCGHCGGGAPPEATQPIAQSIPAFRQSFNSPQRCNDIFNVNASRVASILRAERLVVSSESKGLQGLNVDFVRSDAQQKGCTPITNPNQNCQIDRCYNLYFRTMDGTCNNIAHPEWGAAFIPLMRTLPAQYDDGFGAPLGSRGSRPSAREVARILLESNQQVNNEELSMMMMPFGQFMAHDMSRTSQPSVSICTSCQSNAQCDNIPVQPFDPLAQIYQGCVKMQRQFQACGSNPRDQLNENTAFLDASPIYGSSVADSQKFRDGAGFLKMTFFNNRPMLQFNPTDCPSPAACATANFQAGDDRVNVFIALAGLQTVLTREHNRVVNLFRQLNPHWDGERLYQEGRKLVGAQVQKIVFSDWLPRILGSSFDTVLGSYGGYDSNMNPSISNHFAGAAFRFGHGMVSDFVQRIGPNGLPIINGGLGFLDGVQHSERMLREGGPDPILRGLMLTPVKRPHRVTPAAQTIFGNQDLASLNIERGRDQGIAGYNSWREFCKQPRATTFEDFGGQILNPQVRQQLQQLYGHPDQVDAYVGFLMEDPVQGGMVGPTLACLLGEQFKRLREGDRLFYKNPGVFTPEQVQEIDRASLSKIVCDNADEFFTAPVDAFRFSSIGSFIPCQQISGMNLQAWKEQ